MTLRAWISFAAIVLAMPALAGPPEQSLRPLARPALAEPVPEIVDRAASYAGLLAVPRPLARPDAPAPVVKAAAVKGQKRGALCGIAGLEGRSIPPIVGKMKGCGLADGVEVRAVSGIPLSQPAVMDCTTAAALKTWVDGGAVPAVGGKSGGIARIDVAAHYSCRTRNSQQGAKVSEHGRGHAIDISGLTLADGSRMTVLGDWGKGKAGKILAAMRKSACGPFGTVLGPGSDRFHNDHLHFDTARYRAGPYCR